MVVSKLKFWLTINIVNREAETERKHLSHVYHTEYWDPGYITFPTKQRKKIKPIQLNNWKQLWNGAKKEGIKMVHKRVHYLINNKKECRLEHY